MASPNQEGADTRAPTPLPVVLIHSDLELFARVADACRSVGVPIVAVRHIAELERWPAGHVVVTDVEHTTPFWRDVGAAHVLAVVWSAAQGRMALERGATEWALREHVPASVLAVACVASAPTNSAA